MFPSFLPGAIGGLAHQPMQALMNDGVTPGSVVGGVGKGLVGIVTKPIGGAADLLVHTGHGLLQVGPSAGIWSLYRIIIYSIIVYIQLYR